MPSGMFLSFTLSIRMNGFTGVIAFCTINRRSVHVASLPDPFIGTAPTLKQYISPSSSNSAGTGWRVKAVGMVPIRTLPLRV